ncbi:MAG TPA: hypothetical protein VK181_16315 [Rhizobium sp.]|nr:hypothetical protein [Rhizobium sp.]
MNDNNMEKLRRKKFELERLEDEASGESLEMLAYLLSVAVEETDFQLSRVDAGSGPVTPPQVR